MDAPSSLFDKNILEILFLVALKTPFASTPGCSKKFLSSADKKELIILDNYYYLTAVLCISEFTTLPLNVSWTLYELNKKDTLGGINFDSVIIADFGESLKSVATSLLYTDVSSKRISYITLNQWFDNSLLKETSLQPIYFPSINKENFKVKNV